MTKLSLFNVELKFTHSVYQLYQTALHSWQYSWFLCWLIIIILDSPHVRRLAQVCWLSIMMTPSNENIFRVTCLCAGNSPVTGEFPSQRPVTRSFDIFSDLRLSKRLSKQSKHRWFETQSRSLWRHSNDSYSVPYWISYDFNESYCKIHIALQLVTTHGRQPLDALFS